MIAGLVNHLWQSTLVACVIGLLMLILRKNRAALRHGLWLAASVKFLAPFSLLIGLGSELEWRKAPTVAEPRLDAVLQIRDPIAMAASPAGSLRRSQFAPRQSCSACGCADSPPIVWRGGGAGGKCVRHGAPRRPCI